MTDQVSLSPPRRSDAKPASEAKAARVTLRNNCSDFRGLHCSDGGRRYASREPFSSIGAPGPCSTLPIRRLPVSSTGPGAAARQLRYQRLGTQGYRHTAINVAASGDPAHIAMPGAHRVAALLKRWLTGTPHYSVSDKHLDYYLDEFAFRFNRRNASARGLLFHRLLQQAVNTDPHPYHELTAGSIDQWLWD